MSGKARELGSRLRIRDGDDRPRIDPDNLRPAPTAPEVDQEPPVGDPVPIPPPNSTPAAVDGTPARRPRRKPAPTTVVSALDDPAVTPGQKGYRSFYVDDGPYARFRAAMYWLARHPEVVRELGDSMSAAAERWMDGTASDLEQRFNSGQVFEAPPASRRRKPRQ